MRRPTWASRPESLVGGGGGGNTDPVKQTNYPPATPPVALASFTGITYTGSLPPDTNLAVGATQVVEVVNSQYAVFDKSGTLLLGPANMYQMFASMTGDDCSWRSGGDPVVLYDRLAGRWLVARYLFTPNILCVAVSQTTDATGAFNLYSYAFGPNTADYPKFGVWPDGYYFTANTFAANNGPFMGAQACAFDRDAMLAGFVNASVICFQGNTSWHSLLPSDLDSDLPPPAGSPNYFMQLDSGALSLFKFRPNFATPVNSTFTGPTTIPSREIRIERQHPAAERGGQTGVTQRPIDVPAVVPKLRRVRVDPGDAHRADSAQRERKPVGRAMV